MRCFVSRTVYPQDYRLGPIFNNAEFINSFSQSFIDMVLFSDPNDKFSSSNLTPNWKTWSQNSSEMLFNETSSGQPDIMAITTYSDVTQRCAYVLFPTACWTALILCIFSFWKSVSVNIAQWNLASQLIRSYNGQFEFCPVEVEIWLRWRCRVTAEKVLVRAWWTVKLHFEDRPCSSHLMIVTMQHEAFPQAPVPVDVQSLIIIFGWFFFDLSTNSMHDVLLKDRA